MMMRTILCVALFLCAACGSNTADADRPVGDGPLILDDHMLEGRLQWLLKCGYENESDVNVLRQKRKFPVYERRASDNPAEPCRVLGNKIAVEPTVLREDGQLGMRDFEGRLRWLIKCKRIDTDAAGDFLLRRAFPTYTRRARDSEALACYDPGHSTGTAKLAAEPRLTPLQWEGRLQWAHKCGVISQSHIEVYREDRTFPIYNQPAPTNADEPCYEVGRMAQMEPM
jgi:hypothetical protein